MKNRSPFNLVRKDWIVVIALLLLVVAFVFACGHAISTSGHLDDFHSIKEAYDYLIQIATFCIVFFPLAVVATLYYFIKTASINNERQQKKKENVIELEQNYALLQDFYENAPIGFHAIDIEGNFLDMNKIELEWLGYTKEEVVGKMTYDQITVRSVDNLHELLGELIRTGKLDNVEGSLIRKDGSLMPCFTNSRLIYDEEGKITRIRVAVMNYSEKKKIEVELKKAKEIAERSSLLKDQFVANVSHEIRTPLNAILSFSKLLERTPLNDRQQEFIHSIHTGSENLLNIINDILDFSKIEAGVLRIDKIVFNPRIVMAAVEKMFRYRAEEKELDFYVNVADKVPTQITGDPNRLTQILINLLGNAFKFTEKGSISLDVNVAKQVNNTIHLIFEVQDTGIGIPATKVNEIFKRFGQVVTGSTREYGGAGLGLTITKQLVDLQGGTIKVKSAVGEGTYFTTEIPYEISDLEAFSKNDVIEKPSSFNNKKISVLVAEDNPTNRRIFQLQFENLGIVADYAENGRIAVEMLREKTYDLVLMDIQMPEMDGYSATKAIRNELNIKVPIIAVTAHVFSGEREKCIAHGMNDYLPKPMQEEELFGLLKSYLPNALHENKNRSGSENGKPKRTHAAVETDFDRKYVFALTRGNKETLAELANLTINQSALEIQEIEKAMEQKNYNNIQASSHSMRSTVLNMGFNKLMGPTLGKLGEEANKKLPDHDLLSQLFSELKQLREEAVRFLTTEFLSF